MWSYLRPAVAAITGAVVTILLAYLGAIILLVVRVGIPLGSAGREPSSVDYAVLLAIAAGAAAIGGHIAAGLARQHSRSVVIGVSALLACGALWGFTSPGSEWPTWWPPALALVAAVGTAAGGWRRPPGR
jgi:hypothetical protein